MENRMGAVMGNRQSNRWIKREHNGTPLCRQFVTGAALHGSETGYNGTA